MNVQFTQSIGEPGSILQGTPFQHGQYLVSNLEAKWIFWTPISCWWRLIISAGAPPSTCQLQSVMPRKLTGGRLLMIQDELTCT